MKKVAGILVVVLVLGLAVSSAVSAGVFVSASKAVDSNSVYNAFWDILENESYLVYKLNVTHDLSAAPALVKNSRRGEENAAEISALIWVARNELKASGVKTYYTADELRAMAQNISKNGLPEDTVKSLKEQGWTDDEIKALEDYIRKNADNITSGFDMLEFLKNFSKAFVDVAFRYSSYESWAIWKWKWEGLPDFTDTIPDNVSINPLLAQDWMDLYAAYASNNTTALVKAAGSMSADMYFLVTSMGSYSSKPVTLVFLKDKKIMNYGSSLDDLLFFNNLLVADVEHTNFDFKNPGKFTTYTWHIYWQNPLKAYNLTRQIYSLAFAMENGNDNPELRWILNEKMDELKESLIANITEEVSVTDIKNHPIKIEPPHQPIGMQSRGGSSSSPQVTGTKTSVGYTLTSHTPTEIELEAITPNNDEGRLDVDNISVVVDSKSSDSVSYHIEVMVEAEKNAVSDVEVNLTDDTTDESDSGNLGLIYEGSFASWRSHEFTASVSGDTITIHGSVSITYTPNCGDSPTSTHGKITPATCNEPHTITRSYSKTVELDDTSIDPSKVHFTIQPSKTHVTAGKSVDFNITITNDNNNELSGYYSVKISIPQPNGDYEWASYNDHVSVPAHKAKTLHVTTITYGSPGTSEYYGTFDFGVSSASDSGEVIVSSSGGGNDQPSGDLEIESVQLNPNSNIKDGDSVSFNVVVNNSYSSSKQVELELFIDGKEVDSASGSVRTEGSFTLHWVAEEGTHEWRVELWEIDVSKSSTGATSGHNNSLNNSKDMPPDEGDGGGSLKDVKNGKVHVGGYPYVGYLEVSPSIIHPGQKVNFTVTLKNKKYHGPNGITIFVKDENGNILFDDYFSFNETNQQKTKTYHPVISSVGTHKYTLYVKTYPEYPLNTVSLEVRGSGQFLEQVSFSCTDMYFNYHWSHLIYEAPLSCTAVVENPTDKRIIIDSVEIANMSFPFSSSWTIEHPSRIDGNSAGDILFKTTVTAGESKVLLWWGTDVWIDLTYMISGLQEGANEDTTMVYHARYTQIQVDADKKDIVADSFGNLIGFCSGYYEVEGLIAIALNGLRDSKDALAVLNGIVQFGKWVLGRLQGG